MNELINLLLTLAIACVSNILLGTYYNINVKHFKFDFMKFLNGIVKAFIIGFGFFALYYIMLQLPSLSEELGLDPVIMLYGAIGIYATNVARQLLAIIKANSEEAELDSDLESSDTLANLLNKMKEEENE